MVGSGSSPFASPVFRGSSGRARCGKGGDRAKSLFNRRVVESIRDRRLRQVRSFPFHTSTWLPWLCTGMASYWSVAGKWSHQKCRYIRRSGLYREDPMRKLVRCVEFKEISCLNVPVRKEETCSNPDGLPMQAYPGGFGLFHSVCKAGSAGERNIINGKAWRKCSVLFVLRDGEACSFTGRSGLNFSSRRFSFFLFFFLLLLCTPETAQQSPHAGLPCPNFWVGTAA